MVGRVVRVMAAFAVLGAASAGCTPPDDGGGPTSTTTTIDENSLATCRTERASIATAYAAARASQMVVPGETVFDYLDPTSPPGWFVLEPGPTTGPVQRIAGTLAAVPEVACAAIPLSQVPLGST